MRGNWNFIHKLRSQPLDRTNGCQVVRITGNGDRLVNRPDKRSNGTAGIKGIAMSSKPFFDLEAYVPSANPDMLGITDPEIDVASVGTIRNFNAKMISWHEVAQRITGNH
jgi:hypothetical protein